MSFALNQEIMKKSFMMGDDGNRFTHNAAKKNQAVSICN